MSLISPVRRQHYVVGFQIAMQHAHTLEHTQSSSDLFREFTHFLQVWLGIVVYPLPQGHAIDVFTDMVEKFAVGYRLMDFHDARIVDSSPYPLLAQETFEVLGVLGKIYRRNF